MLTKENFQELLYFLWVAEHKLDLLFMKQIIISVMIIEEIKMGKLGFIRLTPERKQVLLKGLILVLCCILGKLYN